MGGSDVLDRMNGLNGKGRVGYGKDVVELKTFPSNEELTSEFKR